MAGDESEQYPSARVLLLDVHGEYSGHGENSGPLSDVSQVFGVEPQYGEQRLYIPYWALDTGDLLDFLTGGVTDSHETAFTDKIYAAQGCGSGKAAVSGCRLGIDYC